MSRRSFIFCDVCNPLATRTVEMRRGGHGRDPRMGRRVIDGRAWFDGDDEGARKHGWVANEAGNHVCPVCASRIRKMAPHMRDHVNLPNDVLDAIFEQSEESPPLVE